MIHRKSNRTLILVLLAVFALTQTGCELLNGLFNPLDSEKTELESFSSCMALEAHLKTEALRTAEIISGLGGGTSAYSPFGFVSSDPASGASTSGTAPSSGGTAVSETNNQEAGVNEADIFQVDATHAFALRDNELIIMEVLDGQGDGAVTATVEIEGYAIEMFLDGNNVVVLTDVRHSDVVAQYSGSGPSRPSSYRLTKALVFDVSDRTAPELTREVAVEGEYVSARRIDDRIYIIARAMLEGPSVGEEPSMLSDWLDIQAIEVVGASLDSWIPYSYSAQFDGGNRHGQSVERASCTRTYHSPAVNGDDAVGIFSFDLSTPENDVESTTIIGDGSLVYASPESIIIAMTNYADVTFGEGEGDPDLMAMLGEEFTDFDELGILSSWGEDSDEPSGPVSHLHRFELAEDGRPLYDAMATVEGWVLNQFSISEYDGYIRVATEGGGNGMSTQSMVFTYRVASDISSDVSMLTGAGLSGVVPSGVRNLPVAGSLRNIGVDEDLYATRFNGDWGYLVTFRQIDPLWVIDLSNPENPVLCGDLEVPGFSTYLHPIDGNRLIGIGRTGPNNNDAIKLSLFDVSNANNPIAIDEETEGYGSEALYEHRAFRYIDDLGLLAVPIEQSGTSGLFLYQVSNTGLQQVATIHHHGMSFEDSIENTSLRRAYRVGNHLYTFSYAGVSVTDLSTFDAVGMIEF